jgi:hypothetical protein
MDKTKPSPNYANSAHTLDVPLGSKRISLGFLELQWIDALSTELAEPENSFFPENYSPKQDSQPGRSGPTAETDYPDDVVQSPPKPFDAGWKMILYTYLYPLVQKIFPDLYHTLDTTFAPEFLNTELQKLDPQASIGHLYPDVLVRIRSKQGHEQLILCHIEVQTKIDTSIEERMFRYAIRIYHYFNQIPLGILIMADPSKNFRPSRYRFTEPHTGLTTEEISKVFEISSRYVHL